MEKNLAIYFNMIKVKVKRIKKPPKKLIPITNLIPENKPIMCCFGFRPPSLENKPALD